jgi:N-ethylmaleimide reductase
MTNPWSPLRLGDIELEHRLAMAPMTRDRSAASGAPTAMNADYYAQRASMGLVITDGGTQPSELMGRATSFNDGPGIYTEQHVRRGRLVEIQRTGTSCISFSRATPIGAPISTAGR